jgi:ribosomal protein S18 acetylase RimI-like enzyme
LPRHDLDFRQATEDDREFLYNVYASTREEEVRQAPWTPAQRQAFLAMQARAQDKHYREYFPDAEYLIIMVNGQDAGRLYLARTPAEIRIVDIALLPRFRGMGLGQRILRNIQTEAAESDLPVRIHVEKNNPALRMYQRLKFVSCEDKGVYWLMEYRPGSHKRRSKTDS